MQHVLVIQSFHPAGMAMLEARQDIRLTVTDDMSFEHLSQAVRDADIIAVRNQPLPAALLEHAPKLTCIAKHGVGVDKIDLDYCSARNIPVINTPGANAVSVAEQTVALILACAKNMRINDLAVRSGDFAIRESRNTLCITAKKLLLCGFGGIGQTVARMMAGFAMEIFFYDPFLPETTAAGLDARRVSDLHAALPAMDVVSLHLPLTEATRGMFGSKELSLMRPDAILVSTARGGIVDEAALGEALRAGRLAAAGLDVFEQEPPDPGSPLLTMDSLIASPHNAALSREGAARMGWETAENIIAFLEKRVDARRIVNRENLNLPS